MCTCLKTLLCVVAFSPSKIDCNPGYKVEVSLVKYYLEHRAVLHPWAAVCLTHEKDLDMIFLFSSICFSLQFNQSIFLLF